MPTHLICQQRILLSTLLIASGLASEFGMCSTEEKKPHPNASELCDLNELCTVKSDT